MKFDLMMQTRFFHPRPPARRDSKFSTSEHSVRFRVYDEEGRIYCVGTTRPEWITDVSQELHDIIRRPLTLRVYDRYTGCLLTTIPAARKTYQLGRQYFIAK